MELSKYEVLLAPFAGWIVAQFIKFVFTLRKDGIHLSDAIQSGGMPSSHSAFMGALTAAIGVTQGISSVSFAIAVALTAIIMYDATGVRRTTGEQTLAIQSLVKKTSSKQPVLHDARGHTPAEVVVGMCVGIFVGIATVVVL
jgi:acid phosphatase family membrane protein YuiD